jgi:hypothetical protein
MSLGHISSGELDGVPDVGLGVYGGRTGDEVIERGANGAIMSTSLWRMIFEERCLG